MGNAVQFFISKRNEEGIYMTKETIGKKINNHTNRKLIIGSLIIISLIMMIFCGIVYQGIEANWIAYIAIISYFLMILMIFLAYRFNFNELLMKTIKIDDYKEMLKYMSEIPNNICTQKYYDGLLMIKRTLNEMVYYHLHDVDETYRNHLCYLQSVFLNENNTSFVSSQVLNKSYLRAISTILLQQIDKGVFDKYELDNVNCGNDEINKKQFHITARMLTNICNVILIIIVLVKIGITVNNNWYDSVNGSFFLRIIYNTSADIIAVVLAIIALHKNE